jgi:hypothetical protein
MINAIQVHFSIFEYLLFASFLVWVVILVETLVLSLFYISSLVLDIVEFEANVVDFSTLNLLMIKSS